MLVRIKWAYWVNWSGGRVGGGGRDFFFFRIQYTDTKSFFFCFLPPPPPPPPPPFFSLFFLSLSLSLSSSFGYMFCKEPWKVSTLWVKGMKWQQWLSSDPTLSVVCFVFWQLHLFEFKKFEDAQFFIKRNLERVSLCPLAPFAWDSVCMD